MNKLILVTVGRLLKEARQLLADDDFSAPAAAAICFDILILVPDFEEASALVLAAFHDFQLIRENPEAIRRSINEWADRAWQQR